MSLLQSSSLTNRQALPLFGPRSKHFSRLSSPKSRLALQLLAVLVTFGTLAVIYNTANSTSANGIGWSGLHWLRRGRTQPAKVLQSPAVPAPVDVAVLSVGSVQDPSKHAAQAATFGQDVRLYTANETLLPQCYLCSDSSFERFPELWYKVKERFQGRKVDWYCQQQRVLSAVRWLLLDKLEGELPAWLLLIGDDIFVNPVNLKKLLRRYDADTAAAAAPAFLGRNNGWKAEFWSYAGAGTLVNRATLQALLRPFDTLQLQFSNGKWVNATSDTDAANKAATSSTMSNKRQSSLLDECIERHLGGSWCHMHSDWAVALCIKLATGIPRPTQTAEMSPNKCPVAEYNKMAGLITCSDMAADQMHYAYGQYVTQQS